MCRWGVRRAAIVGWRKLSENNWRWENGSILLMCKEGKNVTSMEVIGSQWSISEVLPKNQRKGCVDLAIVSIRYYNKPGRSGNMLTL